MISKKADFEITENNIETALQLIKKFLLHVKHEKGTVLYKSFQNRDNKSKFTHFMTFSDFVAEESHKNAPHTIEFVQGLYPICKIPPEFTDLTEVI